MIKIIKKNIFLILLLILTIIYLIPLFHSGSYINQDEEGHVARFAAYFKAFQDGQIIPRWAGGLNFGYGAPVFIFYYPLPGWLASGLHVFGIGYESTYKILIALSFILAPITFYLWARKLFRREVAFIGGLLYGLAPYHFLDLYVRGDVAELLALVLVPIVFLSIEQLTQKKKFSFITLGAISYTLIVLFHNGVSLMFSPVFLLYSIVRGWKKKMFLYIIPIFLIGLSLSAFFWLPALFEGKYTNAKLFIADMYKDHFMSVGKLIYSNWGFGPDVNKPGGLSPQVGIIYITLVLISCLMLIKKKTGRVEIILWIVVFFLTTFITLPLSDFIWSKISLLRLFEFPWRFIALASFAAAVLGCYVLEGLKYRKLLFGLLIVFLLTSIPFTVIKGYYSKSDSFYESFAKTTDYHGAASTIWTAGNPWKYPNKPVEIISGKGTIKIVNKKSQEHVLVVVAKSPVTILDNTIYFPGWKAYVDGNKVPIEFQDINHRGLITFHVPQGTHRVNVAFEESSIRLISDLISLISIVLFIIISISFSYSKIRISPRQ